MLLFFLSTYNQWAFQPLLCYANVTHMQSIPQVNICTNDISIIFCSSKKKEGIFFIIYVQKALSCTNPYWGFFCMLTSQFPSLNAKFSSKKVINKKWAMHIQPLVSLNFSVLGKKRSQCIWIYFCEIFMLSFVQKLLIWLSNASNLRILSM